MKRSKAWVFTGKAKPKTKILVYKKAEIKNHCQPLVDRLKQQAIPANPDKQFNYLADIYTKWHGNYLIFCAKYKSEFTDRIADEFEEWFVRLEYTGTGRFNFSYFRHTGQWHLIAIDLTLNDCLEMIESNPAFQPIG